MPLIRDIRKTEGQRQYEEEVEKDGEVRLNKEDGEGWRQEGSRKIRGREERQRGGKGRAGIEGKGCQNKGKGQVRGRVETMERWSRGRRDRE